MSITESLLAFAAVAALLTVIPGLDTTLVLRSSIVAGRRNGYATALGVNTGAMIWGIGAAVGTTALLVASEAGFMVLKLAGAAYMAYLGGSMLWRSFRRPGRMGPGALASPGPGAAAWTGHATAPGSLPPDAVPEPRERLASSWAKGCVTNLLNPKVGVFYVAMIPQFLPEGVAPLAMGIALAGVHNLLGLAWFTLIIQGTHLFRERLQRPAAARWTDRITGTALLGFGAALALRSR
ncbi:LysE family translocator [Zafaria sp. Z1313]|uniref:LysE family translocator n=1 Tax=unclassified Zafaria TaxID=2828765 RepID=UPI002E7715E6|nr:LysE family translocator [Zafaria sp. J156]MEE1621854.1 LysE family translocator [Zafaria sp. J156]